MEKYPDPYSVENFPGCRRGFLYFRPSQKSGAECEPDAEVLGSASGD